MLRGDKRAAGCFLKSDGSGVDSNDVSATYPTTELCLANSLNKTVMARADGEKGYPAMIDAENIDVYRLAVLFTLNYTFELSELIK